MTKLDADTKALLLRCRLVLRLFADKSAAARLRIEEIDEALAAADIEERGGRDQA